MKIFLSVRLYRLIAPIAFGMQIFALISLQAQNSTAKAAPANAVPSSAATTPAAPPRPISDAQFKKILADTAANGVTAPTAPVIANAFGVNHKDETERRDSFNDSIGNIYTFSKLDNGNYIFSMGESKISHDYYVDKNLILISAVTYTVKDGITVLPTKDAQPGLNAELKYFAGIADQL
jgi:hypothetical protein